MMQIRRSATILTSRLCTSQNVSASTELNQPLVVAQQSPPLLLRALSNIVLRMDVPTINIKTAVSAF
jgi:hypothetical protein